MVAGVLFWVLPSDMLFEKTDRSQVDCRDANKGKVSQNTVGRDEAPTLVVTSVPQKATAAECGQCIQTLDRGNESDISG